MRTRIVSALVILALFASVHAASQKPAPQFVAYIFPQDAVLNGSQVKLHGITRFNYAFANIQNGRMVAGFAHDAENFAVLTGLRKQNPKLTILVSVGGWMWSGRFSDAALTPASRAAFIDSAVQFIAKYQLDGLDIDWEYPGMPGAAGNVFRAEDKQNFTALLRELRVRFDGESRKNGRRLYLTIAAGASPGWIEHTEMDQVARIVDTVNLM
jgi:chitinase